MAMRKKSTKGKSRSTQMTTRQALTTLATISVERDKLMRKLGGLQYGGKRDIWTVAGYIRQGKVLFDDYWALYTRGDVAGRIVDMPAQTTWRTPPEIVEADATSEQLNDQGETPFMEAFNALAKRLRLWQYCSRVDRVAGIGRYAVILIGTQDVTTDDQLKNPIKRLNKPEDVLYLSVYHEANAEILEWETSPTDERFGLPKLYRLKTTNNTQQFGSGQLVVHASRVIHVAENVLEDDVYGRPRLERPLNRLFDLEKISASTGEAYWQTVVKILQATIDPNFEVEQADLDALDEKMSELVHDLKRQFYAQGTKLEWLQSDTPNVSQVGDFFFSLIAGACGIPKRILFGSELGQLASSTDQETYLGMINERQEQFAEPIILRQFIDRLIKWKALPEPITGAYAVLWPSLYEEKETDKAEANLKRAQTAAALAGMGGSALDLVTIDEESNVWLNAKDQTEAQEVLPTEEDEFDLGIHDDDENGGGGGGTAAGDAGGSGPNPPPPAAGVSGTE